MPKILLSAPNTRMNIQQDARALHEVGWLHRYCVPFGVRNDGILVCLARLLDRVTGSKLETELRRRAISEVLGTALLTFAWWEIPRTILTRSGILSWRLAEAAHAHSLIAFDRHVAGRLGRCDAVFGYKMPALETFRAAKKKGLRCIYGMHSRDPRFNATLEREAMTGNLEWNAKQTEISPDIEGRVRRRPTEWKLADIVILNSSVCRDSFRPYGVDIGKAHILPLPFPPVIGAMPIKSQDGPLRILWAGSFSLLKGAKCFFLQALRELQGKQAYDVRVFGPMQLPATALEGIPSIKLSATVSRDRLFDEYRSADVLVLPTLSDGFAMTVAEAMSQGLPVITTRQAGAAMFVIHQENGLLVKTADAGDLSGAMKWCMENRPLLHQIGGRARESARKWQCEDYRAALRKIVSDLFAQGEKRRRS
jgi:glycosyltransferase involved in cell wall biosynthesis